VISFKRQPQRRKSISTLADCHRLFDSLQQGVKAALFFGCTQLPNKFYTRWAKEKAAKIGCHHLSRHKIAKRRKSLARTSNRKSTHRERGNRGKNRFDNRNYSGAASGLIHAFV